MVKLHLGCGNRYLDGYINIDYPASEHSVQSGLKADRHVDIIALEYAAGSVDEIRLHHVFEHFPRQTALALLCRWTDWLVPDGTLRIETPDVMASAWALVSPFTSSNSRQQIIRHLFGSHEAAWAVHWDGWYKEKFAITLEALGFIDIVFKQTRWEALRNIEVLAKRGPRVFTIEDYRSTVRELLSKSLITYRTKDNPSSVAESEQQMLDLWLHEWETTYIGKHLPVGHGLKSTNRFA